MVKVSQSNPRELSMQEFFKLDYVDQASYDNLRKISSCVDGLKNSNRKVIYTLLEKSIYDLVKVQQLASKVAEFTDYLHGSLEGVVANLGQDFMGSNQLPLLQKKGNFGTRTVPVASAGRYIYAKGSEMLPYLFSKDDRNILIHQSFEGAAIEPRFLLPVIPTIFVNGNRGVSSGFSQLIGQREIKEIIKILVLRLQGKILNFDDFNSLPLYYNGFEGNITRDPEVTDKFRWILDGTFEHLPKTKANSKGAILITELPPETKLITYIQFLDSLQEDKKIKSFKDECNGDSWQFRVQLNHEMDASQIIKLFKLRSFVTENFTCLGSDNKIKEFSRPSEILDHYYETRIEFLHKRKEFLGKSLDLSLSKKKNMLRFIQMVTDGELELKGMTTASLNSFLKQESFDTLEDNYRYLTVMPMSSMQKDSLIRLEKEIKDLEQEKKDLLASTVEDIWLTDIKEFATYSTKKKII